MPDYQGARKRVPLRERMDSILGRLPETTRTAMSPLLGGPQGVGILDVLPGTGEALAANDYVDAREAGDSFGQGIAALGAVPVVGAAGRGARVARAAAKAPRIRGWHGSPYEFERFDLSKIGTGEGAQAFGHGAYIGGRESTARFYRDTLAAERDPLRSMMRGLGPDTTWADVQAAAAQSGLNLRDENIADILTAVRGRNPDGSVTDDAFESFRRLDRGFPQIKGHMYEVDILASPDELLDWDAPLSQQPGRVRQGYASALGNGSPLVAELLGDLAEPESMMIAGLFPKSIGAQAYNTLASGNAAAASKRLLDAGIPGIRYLDGNSRAAGEGSHNYVIFDPDRIEILRRYGLLPPAMVATQQAMQDRQPPRRQEPPRKPRLADLQQQLRQAGY